MPRPSLEGRDALVSRKRQVITVDDFFAGGSEMRGIFDTRLGERRGVSRDRFVWDYWHVQDQYTYVRTFADEFFPPDLYARFVDHLLAWGRETLGCTRIVPPWLSYYIDGCRQELHADIPHGPWAYVFSLTNWDDRGFHGGETLLLSPQTLDFWASYDASRFSELGSFVELIEPRFNRLTVFDPRIPHGVRAVEGTREPLDSRIAVHGWFDEPSLVVSDAIEQAGQRRVFEATLATLLLTLRDVDDVGGVAAVRVDVRQDGEVATRIASSSLVSPHGDGRVDDVERSIEEFFADVRIRGLEDDGWVVVPVSLPVGSPAGGNE